MGDIILIVSAVTSLVINIALAFYIKYLQERKDIEAEYQPIYSMVTGCVIDGRYKVKFPEEMQIKVKNYAVSYYRLLEAMCRALKFQPHNPELYQLSDNKNILYFSLIGIGNYDVPEDIKGCCISRVSNATETSMISVISALVNADQLECEEIPEKDRPDPCLSLKFIFEDIEPEE